MAPLTAQLDVMLFGAFGLGSVSADLALTFNASIDASLQIALNIQNPLVNIQLLLSAIANVQASLSAAFSIPQVPTAQLAAQISANAAFQGAIGAKLSGIQAVISAALAVKLPAIDFLASLTANLSAGPVVVASWGFANPPDTLVNTGAQIDALFSGGVGGIAANDTVYGVLVLTKSPSASAAISATLLVA
jgi:hypothetical protein